MVPRELVYSCRHFRREMRGITVPRDIYVSICGTDLVRLPDGSFAVLEDNLRVPSGVSYMLANRKVLKRSSPRYSATTVFARSIITRRRCSQRCGRWLRVTPPRATNRRSCC